MKNLSKDSLRSMISQKANSIVDLAELDSIDEIQIDYMANGEKKFGEQGQYLEISFCLKGSLNPEVDFSNIAAHSFVSIAKAVEKIEDTIDGSELNVFIDENRIHVLIHSVNNNLFEKVEESSMKTMKIIPRKKKKSSIKTFSVLVSSVNGFQRKTVEAASFSAVEKYYGDSVKMIELNTDKK